MTPHLPLAPYHVRSDGTIVDAAGASFFAFGFYTDNHETAAIKADIATVGAGGFNLMFVEPYDLSAIAEILDAAANYPALRMIWDPIKGAAGGNLPQIYNLIPTTRQKTALFSYALADDVHSGSPLSGWPASLDDVKMLNDAFHMRDLDHPTFVALGNGPNTVFDVQRFDISGQEIYPVNGGSPIRLVYESTLSCVTQAAQYTLSPWTLPQTSQLAGGDEKREPTAAEYRNMLYQSIAAGAKGIANYSFSIGGPLNTRSPAVWAEAVADATELRTIAPFLTDGKLTRQDLGDGLYASIWEREHSLLVVVVHAGHYGTTKNPNDNAPDTRTVNIALPPGIAGAATPAFAGRSAGMTIVDGKLKGSIELLGVHAYTIAK